MLKKVLVAVVAAGAMSVPLAGVAWADKPDDPGAGNQGVPDRATAVVVNTLKNQGVPDTVQRNACRLPIWEEWGCCSRHGVQHGRKGAGPQHS